MCRNRLGGWRSRSRTVGCESIERGPARKCRHAETSQAEASHSTEETRIRRVTDPCYTCNGNWVSFSRVWQGSAGDRRPYADQLGLLFKRSNVTPALSE